MGKSPKKRSKEPSELNVGNMPARTVKIGGDGRDVQLLEENFAVAIVGNGVPTKPGDSSPSNFQGQSLAGLWGAAIAGNNAHAVAAKNCVALAGTSGSAVVGDGGLARAANLGFAFGYWNSVAYVDDSAWAHTHRAGVAIARIGVAETYEGGIAGAFANQFSTGGGWASGIAIAGPAGLAVAFAEGALVQAGPGGALAGYWTKPGGKVGLAIQVVAPDSDYLPGTLYRFEGGKFLELTKAETAKAGNDIKNWTKRWGKALHKAVKEGKAKWDSPTRGR